MSQSFLNVIRGANSNGHSAKQNGINMHIKAGLMSGSDREIHKESFVVGSSEDADVILIDEGIAPKHFAVIVSRSLLGTSLAIQAIEAGVEVDNKPLEIEAVATLQQKARVVVKGVEILFSDRKSTANILVPNTGKTDGATSGSHSAGNPEKKKKFKPHMFAAAGSMLCLSIGVIMYGLTLGEKPKQAVVFRSPPPIQNIVKVNFEGNLKQQIAKAGLADVLKVQALGKHSIRVSGDLPKSHSEQWASILRWYDEQQNFPSLLNRVVEITEAKDLPKIRYVWFGKQPFIMLKGNQKVAPGEVLYAGFKLENISPEGIVMTSANRQYKIMFGQGQ